MCCVRKVNEMRWLSVIGVLLYLTRCNDAGALKCHPGSQDPLCELEKKEISSIENLIERDIAIPSDEAQCLPGSEWESNCHRCHCSQSGFAKCAELDSCLSEQLAEPVPCKPNTTFKRDGNTCVCLQNGLALCTLRAHTIEKRSPQEECTPGSSFKKDCNTCHCLPDGRVACTKRGCLDGKSKKKREIPEANSTSRSVRQTKQEPQKTCQPGTEFRMDCNNCLCNDEGQDFSCTRIDCAALNNNGGTESRLKRDTTESIALSCDPGSVFDRDCNVCRCTSDGHHAMCTLKRCQKDSDVTSTEPSQAFRCTPGDQFRRDCNDCTCSADGKNVFCTVRLCDEVLEEITP